MQRFTRTIVASTILLAIVATGASTSGGAAAPADTARAVTAPHFRLVQLPGLSFESPVWAGGAGDGTNALYVVEQRGLVWRVVGRTRTRFLDLRSAVATEGEQGLLSIAFAPNFASTGHVYAYYVRRDGNGQVRRFTAARGRVVAGSGRDVITVTLTDPEATNHNGGNLWMTRQGFLYLSTGDGGGAGDPSGNGQRLDRLAGKLIRITPRRAGGYVVPRSNPFVGRRGARAEIYALGLRNPFRFSIDGPTGDIWIGDVGQDQREEINRLPGGRPTGANFGWRRYEGGRLYDEGTALTSGTRYVRPFLDYGRAGGACSVTGGLVYRGPVRSLRGWYLHADYCTDGVTAVWPATKRRVTRAGVGGIVHFGAGPGGNVYATSQREGRVYRIAAR